MNLENDNCHYIKLQYSVLTLLSFMQLETNNPLPANLNSSWFVLLKSGILGNYWCILHYNNLILMPLHILSPQSSNTHSISFIPTVVSTFSIQHYSSCYLKMLLVTKSVLVLFCSMFHLHAFQHNLEFPLSYMIPPNLPKSLKPCCWSLLKNT